MEELTCKAALSFVYLKTNIYRWGHPTAGAPATDLRTEPSAGGRDGPMLRHGELKRPLLKSIAHISQLNSRDL
jgi:hypothetical protein